MMTDQLTQSPRNRRTKRIVDLSPANTENWPIRCKIVKVRPTCEPKNVSSSSYIKRYFKCWLRDESGTIEVLANNEDADVFDKLLLLDQEYIISGGEVRKSRRKVYHDVFHDYELVLHEHMTRVEPCRHDTNDDDEEEEREPLFSQLELLREPSIGEETVDVVGVVEEVGPLRLQLTPHGDTPLKKIVISDSSGQSRPVALWKDQHQSMMTDQLTQSPRNRRTKRIVDLSPANTENWPIRCKIVKVRPTCEPKNVSSSSYIKRYFKCWLRDESGTIEVLANNEDADVFDKLLLLDQEYIISGGEVRKSRRKVYHDVFHDYELVLHEHMTRVEPCRHDTNDDDEEEEREPLFSQLELLREPSIGEETVDVVGVVEEVGPLRLQLTPHGDTPLKKIVISDSSGQSRPVALWKDQAEKFDAEENSVVALRRVKVKDFQGTIELSSCMFTSVEVNPAIPEAEGLRRADSGDVETLYSPSRIGPVRRSLFSEDSQEPSEEENHESDEQPPDEDVEEQWSSYEEMERNSFELKEIKHEPDEPDEPEESEQERISEIESAEKVTFGAEELKADEELEDSITEMDKPEMALDTVDEELDNFVTETDIHEVKQEDSDEELYNAVTKIDDFYKEHDEDKVGKANKSDSSLADKEEEEQTDVDEVSDDEEEEEDQVYEPLRKKTTMITSDEDVSDAGTECYSPPRCLSDDSGTRKRLASESEEEEDEPASRKFKRIKRIKSSQENESDVDVSDADTECYSPPRCLSDDSGTRKRLASESEEEEEEPASRKFKRIKRIKSSQENESDDSDADTAASDSGSDTDSSSDTESDSASSSDSDSATDSQESVRESQESVQDSQETVSDSQESVQDILWEAERRELSEDPMFEKVHIYLLWMTMKAYGEPMEEPDILNRVRRLEGEIEVKLGVCFSNAWCHTFRTPLTKFPEYRVDEERDAELFGYEDCVDCEACNRSNHPWSYTVSFDGRPYNTNTFVEEPGNDEEEVEESGSDYLFRLGCFCFARSHLYSRLYHWRYHLFKKCQRKLEQLNNDPDRVLADRTFLKEVYHGLKELMDATVSEYTDDGNQKKQWKQRQVLHQHF